MGHGLALIEAVQAELVPRDAENRLLPLVATGRAPEAVFRALATEQATVSASDIRSLLLLAARAGQEPVRDFFLRAAAVEQHSRALLAPLAAPTAIDAPGQLAHDPLPGCQAYPSFVAWLAVNAEPATAVVALIADIAAGGRYCATVATAMREHYDYDDDACAYFDDGGGRVPLSVAAAAVDAGIASGAVDERAARRYARLLQTYELMFWNTLAELAEPS